MIGVFLCLSIFAASLSLSVQPVPPMAAVWMTDYDAAVESARDAGLPLLIVLDDGKLKNSDLLLLISSETSNALARYRICRLNVESEEGKRIAEGYGATEYPYTLITDASCEKIVFRGAGRFSEGAWATTLANHAGPAIDEELASEMSAEHEVHVDNDAALDEQAFTNSDMDSAEKRARRRNRPLLAYVTMNGCHYCELMRQQTLSDDRIQSTVTKTFESVVVHREDEAAWVDQQDIRVYPTTLVFDRDGNVVDRLEGFLPPEQFLGRLGRATAPMVSAVW